MNVPSHPSSLGLIPTSLTAIRFCRALELDFIPSAAPSRKSSTTKDVPA